MKLLKSGPALVAGLLLAGVFGGSAYALTGDTFIAVIGASVGFYLGFEA